MSDLPLTGGCNCGGVRFEVTEPLVAASYCHCTRCQRRSGITERPPRNRRLPDRGRRGHTAHVEAAGRRREVVLRRVRLIALWPQSEPSRPIGIRMGTFDHDPGIRPSVRQFVAYAALWEPIPDDGLPRHSESRHKPS